jgi:hypothetical protein
MSPQASGAPIRISNGSAQVEVSDPISAPAVDRLAMMVPP